MNEVKELTLDSREVAKMLPKRHNNLVRDIETYNGYFSQNSKLSSDQFWQESTYIAGTGKPYKCYQITKKGCEFLAHKMTGKKGALFTAAYINRFHEMEEALLSSGKKEPPILKCTTWKGVPVMTAKDFSEIVGITRHTISYYSERMEDNPSFLVLRGTDLQAYKLENRIQGGFYSSIRVMTYDRVVALAKSMRVWCGDVMRRIKEYFYIEPLPVVAENTDSPYKLKGSLSEHIQRQAQALGVLAEELHSIKRSTSEHMGYIAVMKELAYAVASNCFNLHHSLDK